MTAERNKTAKSTPVKNSLVEDLETGETLVITKAMSSGYVMREQTTGLTREVSFREFSKGYKVTG